jgi:hypothetical protein
MIGAVIGCDDRLHSVDIEDDGRVAYAYLRQGKEIIADVWLYNVAPAPEKAEWKDRTKAPFLNPARFVKPGAVVRVARAADLRARWTMDGPQSIVEVAILHLDTLIAVMRPGSKPGWSKWALRDGPLAHPLDELELNARR